MNVPIFITGIGTGVGKTVVSAIVTEALQANYWKPVQAGFDEGTDSQWVQQHVSNSKSNFFPEVYKLKMPASPHIAAGMEGIHISLEKILNSCPDYKKTNLVIEGVGGLMVPLNEDEFVLDLILKLNAKVILVSRNYLGSINHSLLTAKICKEKNLNVLGWIFNDTYLAYEDEICNWSGFPKITSIGFAEDINKIFIQNQAKNILPALQKLL